MSQESYQAIADGVVDSKVELMPSKTGRMTARYKIGGKRVLLHSSVDPEREAAQLVAGVDVNHANYFIVLGLGLGYHVLALLDRLAQEGVSGRVFVVEPDPDVSKAASQFIDPSSLEQRDVHFLTESDPRKIKSMLCDLIDVTDFRGLELLNHNPSIKAHRQFFSSVYDELGQVASSLLIRANTVILHGTNWNANNIINLPYVVSSPGVKGLFSRFENVPAIIVGAGPSLDKNIDQLAHACDRSVIICCDTALKSLLKRNIIPDMVMAIDGSELNGHGFTGIDRDDITLVYQPMTYFRIVENWRGPRLACEFDSVVGNWVKQYIGEQGEVRTGGSVSTAAFHLAYLLGCNPIVFCGQDLACSDDQMYASGTFYDEEQRKVKFPEQAMIDVEGIDGKSVQTTKFMHQFLQWFDESIEVLQEQNPDVRVIDATEGGALIKGTELMALADVVNRYCTAPVDVRSEVDRLYAEHDMGDVDELANAVQAQADRARQWERISGRGLKAIKDFKQGSISWQRCQQILAEVDDELSADGDTRDLVQSFIQYMLFGTIRRLNMGSETDILKASERIYKSVETAAHTLNSLLGQIAPVLKARAGEGQ